MSADEKPSAEIGEEDQPEHDIQHFNQPVARRERGGDDERQRRQVQYEKAVTEPAGFWRVAFIQIPQPVLETFDATETCNEFPTPHASPKAQGSGIVGSSITPSNSSANACAISASAKRQQVIVRSPSRRPRPLH